MMICECEAIKNAFGWLTNSRVYFLTPKTVCCSVARVINIYTWCDSHMKPVSCFLFFLLLLYIFDCTMNIFALAANTFSYVFGVVLLVRSLGIVFYCESRKVFVCVCVCVNALYDDFEWFIMQGSGVTKSRRISLCAQVCGIFFLAPSTQSIEFKQLNGCVRGVCVSAADGVERAHNNTKWKEWQKNAAMRME